MTRIFNIRRLGLIAVTAVTLAACGGGGEGAVDPNAPADASGANPASNTTATPTDPATAGAVPADPNAAAASSGVVSSLPDTSDGGVVFDAGFDNPAKAFTQLADVDETGGGSGTTTTETKPKTKTTWNYDWAKVLVNGNSYTLKVGTVFPSSTQQFQVESLSANSIVINLTAGEFSDGAEGITLTKGRTLTLLNNSEAINYRLLLVKVHGVKTVTTIASSTSVTDVASAPLY